MIIDNGDPLWLDVLHLSVGGMLLESRSAVCPLGSLVALRLEHWAEGARDIPGRVVHAEPLPNGQHGIGVRFAGLSQEEQHVLACLFAEGPASHGAVSARALIAHHPKLGLFCAAHPYAFLVDGQGAEARLYPLVGTRDPSLWHCVLVGRGPFCDVCIPDPRLSKQHASFERRPNSGAYLVIDRGSSNGTRVGNQPLIPGQPVPITSGAPLNLGGFALSFLSARDVFALNGGGAR
ncbi:MAG TPA: FHA domain-containing protein [Polyangiaceae bacterium]